MEKENQKWVVLKPESTEAEVYKVDENKSTYSQLNSMVGGLIDIVRPANYGNKSILADYDLWVNDEGLLLNMPVNIALNPVALFVKDYSRAGILVGNIIVTGFDDEGNTIGVNPDDIPAIKKALEGIMLCNQYRISAQSKED